ncbi:hypothetical protein BC629DRAFT_968343 [Irpex lacteus]|nr:hypothetical protein BC629DRAFT_968343 [Irpex lacteus]
MNRHDLPTCIGTRIVRAMVQQTTHRWAARLPDPRQILCAPPSLTYENEVDGLGCGVEHLNEWLHGLLQVVDGVEQQENSSDVRTGLGVVEQSIKVDRKVVVLRVDVFTNSQHAQGGGRPVGRGRCFESEMELEAPQAHGCQFLRDIESLESVYNVTTPLGHE